MVSLGEGVARDSRRGGGCLPYAHPVALLMYEIVPPTVMSLMLMLSPAICMSTYLLHVPSLFFCPWSLLSLSLSLSLSLNLNYYLELSTVKASTSVLVIHSLSPQLHLIITFISSSPSCTSGNQGQRDGAIR